MSNTKYFFKSRYIVDVIIEKTYIELVDSSSVSYYIDIKNEQVVSQFQIWFKNIFLKGVNQFLLVFKCHYEKTDGQQVSVIIDNLIHISNDNIEIIKN